MNGVPLQVVAKTSVTPIPAWLNDIMVIWRQATSPMQ
jgi:hypothetical protein